MITSHLYVKHSKSPVYQSPDENSVPTCYLAKGIWVGVLENQTEWVKVVGVGCIGWIKAEALESRPPFELHIQQINPQSLDYVNTLDLTV